MLSIKNLSIWYKKEKNVIDHGSFQVDSNCIIGLLGINGAGKTTLMNTISGIHTKFGAEEFKYNGKEISFSQDEFRKMRYTVFTDEQAFKYWTFAEYKNYIEKVYKTKMEEGYLQYLIEGFQFGDYQKQYIQNLSTGNKKKVFLIAGFALQLPLLILDEPLDGLDFAAAEFLYQVLLEHKK